MRFLFAAAAILLAGLLAGCQSPGGAGGTPGSPGAGVPGDHSLRIGQSLTLPDRSTLTYVRVVADSRCRPDVQCIRAGDADIEFRWSPATGSSQSTVLNSDPRNQQQAPNSARLGPWQVALKGLDWQQPPQATVTITSAR